MTRPGTVKGFLLCVTKGRGHTNRLSHKPTNGRVTVELELTSEVAVWEQCLEQPQVTTATCPLVSAPRGKPWAGGWKLHWKWKGFLFFIDCQLTKKLWRRTFFHNSENWLQTTAHFLEKKNLLESVMQKIGLLISRQQTTKSDVGIVPLSTWPFTY